VFGCPAVLHDGVGAIDTRCVAIGGDFDLNPVQGWAAHLVQLSFDPLKHISCCCKVDDGWQAWQDRMPAAATQ